MAAKNTASAASTTADEAPAPRMSVGNSMMLWDGLRTPDPRRTKRFQRTGGFKGTAIAPTHIVERMTRIFGPCGWGWGWDIKQVDYLPPERPELVNVCVRFWWRMEGLTHQGDLHLIPNGRAEYDHVGGSPLTKGSGDKRWYDDEALKGAVTDAIGKAALQIGMAADIHLGLFDDNKYVKEAERLFDDTERAERPARAGDAPEGNADRRSPEEVKADEIKEWANVIVAQVEKLPNEDESLALLKGIRSGAKSRVAELGEDHPDVVRIRDAIVAKREAIDKA